MASGIFKSGTIAVTSTSAIVTLNAGTIGWLATDIRQGDILRVEGQAQLYFIESRDSLNQITLERPYEGETDASANYAILRMSGEWGSNRALATQVAEYVRLFHADTLTEEALTTALTNIEAALAEIQTTQFMETSGAPGGATGNVGDWAIDPHTGEVWKKTGVSTWTSKGNFKGTIGRDGATIHIVGENPSGALGLDGDLALNSDTSELFVKESGSWSSFGNFVGSVTLATAAQVAAEAARDLADDHADDAAASAAAAAGSATNAANSATGAGASATDAENSATAASNSATAANTAKLAAEAAQAAVAASESNAEDAATAASASQAAAAASASTANTAKNDAEAAQAAAAGSATAASTSATNAAGSATAASDSAAAAAASAGAADGYADDADTARAAAVAAKNAAQDAAEAADDAATAAAGSASAASGSATTASNQATAAANSATTASGHATAAGTSATNAANSATAANTAKTGAETARDAAVSAKTGAETAESNAEGHADDAAASAAAAAQSALDAAAAASGAVSSFNGRAGAVSPETGDYDADQITETAGSKIMTSAERGKLAGIADGATANANDAELRDRATHTGTQAISTVSGLEAALAQTRDRLTANRTYHISTTGNDTTGDGSEGNPLATLNKVRLIAQQLDFNGFTVIARFGAGTFGGASFTSSFTGGGRFQIIGAGPSTVLTASGGSNVLAWLAPQSTVFEIAGMKFEQTGSASCVYAIASVRIEFSAGAGLEFGVAGNRHILIGTPGAYGRIGNVPYTISGGAQRHYETQSLASLDARGAVITMVGTPTFSNAFAYAGQMSLIQSGGLSVSGACNGVPYRVDTGGGIVNANSCPGGSGVSGVVTSPGWTTP